MLLTILVVLILLALAIYVVQLIPLDGRITLLLQIVLVIVAIFYIARAAGLG